MKISLRWKQAAARKLAAGRAFDLLGSIVERAIGHAHRFVRVPVLHRVQSPAGRCGVTRENRRRSVGLALDGFIPRSGARPRFQELLFAVDEGVDVVRG